jgi:hypothetical protein
MEEPRVDGCPAYTLHASLKVLHPYSQYRQGNKNRYAEVVHLDARQRVSKEMSQLRHEWTTQERATIMPQAS